MREKIKKDNVCATDAEKLNVCYFKFAMKSLFQNMKTEIMKEGAIIASSPSESHLTKETVGLMMCKNAM